VDEGTPRLLLEGRPGIGKTTVARRLLNLLHEAGVPVGGFTTAELRTGGLACNHHSGTGQAAPTGSPRSRGCGLTDHDAASNTP
jgi:DNA polymerase III delta prime subunit